MVLFEGACAICNYFLRALILESIWYCLVFLILLVTEKSDVLLLLEPGGKATTGVGWAMGV